MKAEAVLLQGDALPPESRHIARVLDFFGVPWRAATLTEFLGDARLDRESSGISKVLCSSDTFFELVRKLEEDSAAIRPWREGAHSVFVYAGDDAGAFQELLKRLTGKRGVALGAGVGNISVSDQLGDFCRVMAGIQVSASKANIGVGPVLNTRKDNAVNIISSGDGAMFLKLEYKGVPAFLSTSREIIDLDGELTSQNFDVREHFLSSVPLVLYIKWAFSDTCWSAPESNACLIVDDPLLKRTHGFVDFQELLSLMKRHKFSTNIAFIPWNWRRSAPEVVRLFRENPENYSVSVHGCDHTRAEFGSSNEQRLYWKSSQALERMNRHQSVTGIGYDPVMVFPQGIFSEAAMSAVKRTGLIGAVNNDVISADPQRRPVMISDVWDIAVMGYSNFPLFTRRYPWEGIENFAFDSLLGKPAIAVIHHDYCSDHCARLVDFVQRLNALQIAPTWRSLGEVVKRSCRQREASLGRVEVEMYGMELRIENRSDQPKHFVIRKRECESSAIDRISIGSEKIDWKPVNEHIDFETELNPGENQVIKIRFHDLSTTGRNGDRLSYRLKAALRRYLCEVRDNYVTPMRFRFADLVSR